MAESGLQAQRLARMKGIALALLCGAGALYAVATVLEHRHPAWGYVAAFSEAAMVGAIADWFAVVALFRHPLGLPIPHTAIIPRNKDRIGENLASFICDNFLSTAQLLDKIRSFDPAGKLAHWLAQPDNAAATGQHLVAAARSGIKALDDDRARAFIHKAAAAGLQQIDVSHLAGQVLDTLTVGGRHQALLDELLLQVATLLQSENLQNELTEAIAREVKGLRYVGLDTLAAKMATRKIVAAVAHTIIEMAEDPQHSLRLRFDGLMGSFTQRLKDDPAFQEKGQTIRDEWLAHPAFNAYLHGLWQSLQAWLQDDLEQEDSSIRRRITGMALLWGQRLQADTAMREWINAQILTAAPLPIERYREDIRSYIVQRIKDWNAAEMSDELERNIGRDLQFIRINGTLVGGLVGLGIHAATQLLRSS